MNLTLTLLGIIAIYIGATLILASITRVARSFGISQLIIGLTVVTLITAVPELFVAINAVAVNADGIVLGTAVGANIANIGLILGLGGLFAGGMPIATGLVRRGIPLMMIVALAVYILVLLDLLIRPVGIVMVLAFLAFTIGIIFLLRRDAAVRKLATAELKARSLFETQDMLLVDDPELKGEIIGNINRPWEYIKLAVGVILMLYGAQYLVDGALELAQQLDVNEAAVGASIVALATSLPEFIAVFIATQRKQSDVALGNIIGSCVANLLLVLGVASILQPLWIDSRAIWYEFPVMFALMMMLIPIMIDRRIAMWESIVYVSVYVLFVVGVAVL